jgi:fumarylacetoacetate (FAA) hydrolase
MKLASLRSGRDGSLIVVSRNLESAVSAGNIAPTMQAALDNWEAVAPGLQALSEGLNNGTAENAFPLDMCTLAAPLPRSFQYLDGACYLSHIRRNRKARGETLPDDLLQAPMVYQGISHGFLGWNEPVPFPSEDLGIDFEGEIAAVTDHVPMGVSAEEATKYIRLFVLLNDYSLRGLIPAELKRTFGFLTGKPASSLGPIAVTPDELGELWDGKLVGGQMKCNVRGMEIGNINTGIDTPFHYGHMIAHVAQTRNFEPGTIVGLGTVSNEDESAGCACIGEVRALEAIRNGKPEFELLKFGDSVHIEHFDKVGQSVFGPINQKIVQYQYKA